MSFLAVAALGEMLVVMTGGIDLSIPGVITLAGIVVVGSADGANDKLAVAILICLGWSALIGLVNGVLVAVAGLNPLIVTLAVGQIVLGIANERHDQIVVESAAAFGHDRDCRRATECLRSLRRLLGVAAQSRRLRRCASGQQQQA